MKRMRVRAESGGRIVLPAGVRRALGVQIGDEMVLTVEPEGTRIVAPRPTATSLRPGRPSV